MLRRFLSFISRINSVGTPVLSVSLADPKDQDPEVIRPFGSQIAIPKSSYDGVKILLLTHDDSSDSEYSRKHMLLKGH